MNDTFASVRDNPQYVVVRMRDKSSGADLPPQLEFEGENAKEIFVFNDVKAAENFVRNDVLMAAAAFPLENKITIHRQPSLPPTVCETRLKVVKSERYVIDIGWEILTAFKQAGKE